MPNALKSISQIDIIVYPFYLDGFEFEKEGNRKLLKRWISEFQSAFARGNTAFAIAHLSTPHIKEM